MRNEKIKIFFLILLSPLFSFAGGVDVSIDKLGDLLSERHARLQALKLEEQAAEERSGHLVRSFLPSLTLFGAQENFKTGQLPEKSQPAFGAELKLNLFNGGRDMLESDLRRVLLQKKKVEIQRVSSEELLTLRIQYWNILYYAEYLKLVEAAIKTNQKNLQSAERQIRNGVATESDRIEFEMKQVELERELKEAKLQSEILLNDFRTALDYGSDTTFNFPKELVHEHETATAFAHSPKDHDFLYKEQALNKESLEISSSQMRRAWLPQVDAFAGYNQYNEREKDFADAKDRTESVVGLKLSMNLFSGFESSREAGALAKEALAADRISQFRKRQTEAHVSNEVAELEFLHGQVHAAEANRERAEKYYRLTLSEYARGVKNSPDVIGAADKFLEIEKKYFEIIRDFQLTKAHILSKMGK